jgi:hypothetical protein
VPSVMDTVEGGAEEEPLYQGECVMAGTHGSNVLTGYQGSTTEPLCARRCYLMNAPLVLLDREVDISLSEWSWPRVS